ncbi:MAG TPA: hypothetical protein VGG72_30790 [Bryobacteraceae bacterium]|jgi:hypothetical protein
MPRVLALLVLIVLQMGCGRTPKLIEYDEQTNAQARSAPLVVVGVADADAIVGDFVPARSDPTYPMLLHRVRVRVENVLKGLLNERTIEVYYFGFAGALNGPRPLDFGLAASRRILWLRMDNGTFRMACEGWDSCTIFVNSGAHPGYKPDVQKPLDYALADILLTRGVGKIDELRFADEVRNAPPDQGVESHVIEKAEYLAATEGSAIKSAACDLMWVHTQGLRDPEILEQAAASLQAAHCRCVVKAGLIQVCG